MKIYDFTFAPNPRRVRMFLSEKGIKVPYEQVDIMSGQNRTPEFLKKNPMGGLPVLEFDDGAHLCESVAICRYFEGTHPEPVLMGADTRDRAFVEMWDRRMELDLFGPIARAFQNTTELFKGRMQQFPDYGNAQRETAIQRLRWLDGELKDRKFIAGDRLTIADITAFVGIELGRTMGGLVIPEELKNVSRWLAEMSQRPSAQA